MIDVVFIQLVLGCVWVLSVGWEEREDYNSYVWLFDSTHLSLSLIGFFPLWTCSVLGIKGREGCSVRVWYGDWWDWECGSVRLWGYIRGRVWWGLECKSDDVSWVALTPPNVSMYLCFLRRTSIPDKPRNVVSMSLTLLTPDMVTPVVLFVDWYGQGTKGGIKSLFFEVLWLLWVMPKEK